MHLSDTMLAHLVDDVDGIDHVALVLCVETSPDVYNPVALARIVRYADVPDAADLAVTVKDAWQGRGVATALLEVLMRGRPVGVDRIVTEVFNDNRASLLMLCRLGHAAVEDLGSGVSEVVVDLAPLETSASLPRGVDTHADAKPHLPACGDFVAFSALGGATLRERSPLLMKVAVCGGLVSLDSSQQAAESPRSGGPASLGCFRPPSDPRGDTLFVPTPARHSATASHRERPTMPLREHPCRRALPRGFRHLARGYGHLHSVTTRRS